MIRKFKHKQSNSIVTNEGCPPNCYRNSNMACKWKSLIDSVYIENTTDWQEIFEPKYQILSFKHPENGNIYKLNPDGTYGYIGPIVRCECESVANHSFYRKTGLSISFGECLKRYPIHSVKRLSDGQIFKLKDYFSSIKFFSDSKWKIDNIFRVGNEFLAVSTSSSGIDGTFSLDSLFIITEPKETCTVTLTFTPKRPKETVTLNKGDNLLIQF